MSFVPVGVREHYPYYFSYLTGELAESYNTGFKFKFLAFSALPLIAFCWARTSKVEVDPSCAFLLKLYLMLNALFFFIGYIPYSDRIALLSWQIMPLLAIGLTPFTYKPMAAAIALLAAAACMLNYVFF